MTFKKLCEIVYFCGLKSTSKVYAIDPKNKKRYVIKGMSRYGTDSGSLEFGIIELEEEYDKIKASTETEEENGK